MIKTILSTCLLFTTILTISGCSSKPPDSQSDQNNSSLVETQLPPEIDALHPLAVIQNQQILLVDPDYPDPKAIHTLTTEEIPPTLSLFSLKVSPNRRYIIWYAPAKGLLSLDLKSSQVNVIFEPSEWLNQNPYFSFMPGEDRVMFVDNKGTELFTYDLNSAKLTSIIIPYPFGNIFRISPNGQHLIFVSGFGQSDKYPQYMFTTINGENPKRFITESSLNKRAYVEWLPDSSGVILISETNQILFVSQDKPNQQEVYYQLENQDSEITFLGLVDTFIYLSENDRVWEVIDTSSKKRISRSPTEIAEELYRPTFIPWYDKSFLIEETLRLDPEQFNRLWKSNFMGIKKVVLDRYQETTVTSDTPEI